MIIWCFLLNIKIEYHTFFFIVCAGREHWSNKTSLYKEKQKQKAKTINKSFKIKMSQAIQRIVECVQANWNRSIVYYVYAIIKWILRKLMVYLYYPHLDVSHTRNMTLNRQDCDNIKPFFFLFQIVVIMTHWNRFNTSVLLSITTLSLIFL